MTTLCQNQTNRDVGRTNRPRAHVTSPRGERDVAGVPKGDRPPTSPLPTTWAGADEVKPPTSDPRDEARALAEFNAALQEAVNAEFGGAAF
jgi:hypothetical protein